MGTCGVSWVRVSVGRLILTGATDQDGGKYEPWLFGASSAWFCVTRRGRRAWRADRAPGRCRASELARQGLRKPTGEATTSREGGRRILFMSPTAATLGRRDPFLERLDAEALRPRFLLGGRGLVPKLAVPRFLAWFHGEPPSLERAVCNRYQLPRRADRAPGRVNGTGAASGGTAFGRCAGEVSAWRRRLTARFHT